MIESQYKRRRALIRLIAFVAIIQIGILAYLWTLLRPSKPQETIAESTPTQYQLPTRPPRDDTQPTPTPVSTPEAEEVTSSSSSPVRATNYVRQAAMFDEELALEHLAYLASDELTGRQPGTPGGLAAGAHIADSFGAYGLQPAGENGSYFQTFTVPYGRITELPVLTVIPPGGETLTRTYAYRTDYRVLTGGYIGAGTGEGPVVWLSECLHDDYTGLDMVGKVAMCRYSRDPQIYRQAVEHQVGGLLLLDREGQISLSRRPGYRETSWVPQTIPTYLISETVASDLLIGTGYTLDDLSLRFTTTPLSTTVRMAVTIEEQEEVEARNVLGLLPGSDPEYSDEIVVVGAHYDHLGREPDGRVMSGANDNASGVATMLEIARLWQAQDYRPARSVLFAAWDGEEQGLLGSRHYAQHPTNSLTRTVAVINLDMVGAGEALRIDGGGIAATQLQASAETYDITTTLTFDGSSDHVSFYEVGIPAANLIWWPEATYHTPDDKPEIIEPDKLKTVGVLASHALAALAQGHVELHRTVEQLGANILAGNMEAFLAGVDPQDPALRASQAAWFDDLWSRELVQAVVQPSQVRIGDGVADVTLTASYSWAGAARPTQSISYDVRFVERDGKWYFAGYELDRLAGDLVTVARFPDVPVNAGQLLSRTQEAYVSLAADLAFEPILGTRFIYYPDAPTMRTIARPATDQATRWLVSSSGLAEIAWGHPITPALVHLLLNQMGLPPDGRERHRQGDWLREGLVSHFGTGSDADHLPPLAATDVLTSLLDFPDLDGLPSSEARALRGYAWSATQYLLDRYGTQGLHALCRAWGQNQDPEAAFVAALDLSAGQFEAAWRAEQIEPLRADAAAIRATIAARVEAVLAGDEAGFLDTVNPADPVLQAEERYWFSALADHPIATYAASGEITDWSPGSEQASVRLNVEAATTDGPRRQVAYDARFVRSGDRWYYAGAAWNQLANERFVLKYQDHDAAWAGRVLARIEAAYDQVTADLGDAPARQSVPQEIKIHDDGEVFHTVVSLSLPDWTHSRAGPGESIRLALQDGRERTLQRTVARELAHRVLSAQGLDSDWLHAGVASFEAGRATPLGTHWMAGDYLPIVQEAVRRHDEFPLYDMPSWEEVAEDQTELFAAQSWSFVSAIVEQHGLPGLRRFISQSTSSDDVAANLRAALGVDPDAFQEEWRARTFAASAPADLVSLAQRFDPERALAHVIVLSSPEFEGREAGARGAERAAAYIANQFADLGLEPLGDLPVTPPVWVTTTAEMTAEMTVAMTGTRTTTGAVASAGRSYHQQFPVSHTHLISVPTFTLLDDEGRVLLELTYNEDFVERAGDGLADGELVWLRPGSLEGLHFGGAVVLQRDVRASAAYAASLQARGAGGLVVANGRDVEGLQRDKLQDTSETDAPIPVFEITETAFEELMEALGTTYRDLIAFQSPALPLGAQARQSLARLPITTTRTANVLGLLPGSDPDLADEVLLIGAHYDHIGASPDGLYFPGANQNASGVGVMLEMIWAWQSAGYRPARSVVFAAWGAQEMDGAGVAHYLADPAIPLTRTMAVIALDTVGGGDGQKLLYYGTREHDTPLIHRIEAGASELDRRAWRRGSAGEGWHVGFNQAGIPTTKLIWDDAESDFYSLADTAAAIDLDRLATSGEILTLTTAWLAQR
jgi:Zn-dependent M28 family amino/carboxypeptidase/uncharacterized protein YchJ